MPQTQNCANLANTIDSISAGGGAEPEKKDVNFYDYDGVRLYAYTFAEASALSALPSMPLHEGLTAQEWNSTLEQVQSSAQIGYPLDVGATYTTSDGSTRLYFYVAKGTKLPDFRIYMYMAANSSATVDWGDGTTASVSNTGSSGSRVYAEKTNAAEVNADTTVCVKIIGGSFAIGYGSYNVYGLNNGEDSMGNMPMLVKAELGSNCTGIAAYALSYSYFLASIVLANSVTQIDVSAFNACINLSAVVLPKNATIDEKVFRYCTSLVRIVFPSYSHSYIAKETFSYCSLLSDIVIPYHTVSLGINSFSYNVCLTSVVLPPNITNIYGEAFSNCRRLSLVDLTGYTNPSRLPSLAGTSAFNNTPTYLKFKVANQQMLDAFSAATNWSNFASKYVIA